MGLGERFSFSGRRRMDEDDAREAERRALINDLAIRNPRYAASPNPSLHTSGYASSTITLPAVAPAPAEAEAGEKGTSWFVSVFLVANAALGAGLLNFPHAVHAAGGVLSALSVSVVLILFACSTLIILAYCADTHKSPTYQDIIKSCLGSHFHTLCSLCIVVYCYGSCITFLIVIGDQLDRFFWSYNADFCHVFYTNRSFTTIASSLLFILPLCYPKRIDFLKYASTAGVAAIVYIVFLQGWKYFDGEYRADRGNIKHGPDQWSDVFLIAPTIFFGYQCHISAVPIYHCLKGRSTTTFLKTALTAMAVLLATYSLSAVFGYLTFGGNVSDDILQNYDPNDPWVLVAMVAITLKTFTSYPLLSFCGRAGVDSLWVKLRGLSASEETHGERRRRVFQASLWFFSSIALAILTPGIGIVISFLGAFAATFIVVFPGLCLIRISMDGDISSSSSSSSSSSHLAFSARGNDASQLSSLGKTKTKKLGKPTLCLFVTYGLFLVVLGMFIFGIILTNSCMTKTTKIPLCV